MIGHYKDLSDSEIKFIIENHYSLKYDEIANALKISKAKVVAQTQKLQERGILGKKPRRRNWTKEQEEKLIFYFNDGKDVGFLMNLFNKNYDEIVAKLRNLKKHQLVNKEILIKRNGIQRKNKYCGINLSQWSKQELNLLSNLVKTKSIFYISERLKKTTYDILLQSRVLYANGNKISVYILPLLKSFSKKQDECIIQCFLNKDRETLIKNIPKNKLKLVSRRAKLFGFENTKYHSSQIPSDEVVLMKILDDLGIQYKHQKRINYKHNKFYIVDFFIEPNIIFEVYGDYWHGNKKIFNTLNTVQIEKKEKDKKRQLILENLGYKFYIFWENDLNNNKEKCINQIKALLP